MLLFLLFVFLMILSFSSIMRFVVGYRGKDTIEEMYSNFEQQGYSQQESGRVRIYKNPQPEKKKSKKELLKDFGEYTDFEEVS